MINNTLENSCQQQTCADNKLAPVDVAKDLECRPTAKTILRLMEKDEIEGTQGEKRENKPKAIKLVIQPTKP